MLRENPCPGCGWATRRRFPRRLDPRQPRPGHRPVLPRRPGLVHRAPSGPPRVHIPPRCCAVTSPPCLTWPRPPGPAGRPPWRRFCAGRIARTSSRGAVEITAIGDPGGSHHARSAGVVIAVCGWSAQSALPIRLLQDLEYGSMENLKRADAPVHPDVPANQRRWSGAGVEGVPIPAGWA